MIVLKQSTAVDVLIGPFLDLTDAKTAETGESPSVKLSKNGQALAAKSDVTTPIHDADGFYNCELDATDTNTVGSLVLSVAASANALPIRHEFQVVEESVYNNMFAASAVGPLTAAQVNAEADTAIADAALATAANLATVDTVVDGIQTDLSNATDGLGAIKTAVDAIPTSNPTVAAIADGVWDELQSGHVTAGSFGEIATEIASILTDTNELQTDWADGGRLDLIIDAILADTGTDGVVISATQANAIADAILNRDMSAVSDTNARSMLNALRFLRNKWSITGTTLTVTKEDDTTSAWTAALTSDAAADPVTASDPA